MGNGLPFKQPPSVLVGVATTEAPDRRLVPNEAREVLRELLAVWTAQLGWKLVGWKLELVGTGCKEG